MNLAENIGRAVWYCSDNGRNTKPIVKNLTPMPLQVENLSGEHRRILVPVIIEWTAKILSHVSVHRGRPQIFYQPC